MINRLIDSHTEKSPAITVDNTSLSVSVMLGDANLIKIEATTQAKANTTSIIAVKNLEFIIWLFVTGRVWVRYDSSP